MLNVEQERCEYQFLAFALTQRGVELESTVLVADTLPTWKSLVLSWSTDLRLVYSARRKPQLSRLHNTSLRVLLYILLHKKPYT